MILVAGSLYCADTGERVFNDREILEADFAFIDSITNKKSDVEPNDKEIREMARTQPWRTTWTLSKPNPFNTPVFNLMEYQQSLMVYSNMYDNIRESTECPSDNIINDDDCCDGWLIFQSRKREKELRQKQTQNTLGKAANAGEVFIPVKNKDDFQKVNSMNDTGGKMVLKQRAIQIKKQGVVKDTDLADNKVKQTAIQIQQFKEKAGVKK